MGMSIVRILLFRKQLLALLAIPIGVIVHNHKMEALSWTP